MSENNNIISNDISDYSHLSTYPLEQWINPNKYERLDSDEDSSDTKNLCISFENVLAASKRIEHTIVKTPMRYSRNLSNLLGCNLYMKCGFYF